MKLPNKAEDVDKARLQVISKAATDNSVLIHPQITPRTLSDDIHLHLAWTQINGW